MLLLGNGGRRKNDAMQLGERALYDVAHGRF